jgi:hypothetical protein
MNTPAASVREHDKDERAISSLCDRTGASHAVVSVLFAREFARLAVGATVRPYLRLLATANVYANLRRAKAPRRGLLPTLRGSVPQPRQAIQAVGSGPCEQDVEAPVFLPARKQG